jgi:hypothetical protein
MTANIFSFVRFPKRNDSKYLQLCPVPQKEWQANLLNLVRFPKRNDSRYIWVSLIGKLKQVYSIHLSFINIHFIAKLGHSVFNYLLPQEYEYRGYSHSYGPS